MPREKLRFGIAAVGGYRAATWKVWTDGAPDRLDLYLACRRLGGHLKTSLHASGQWHTAYTRETFESAVKDVVPQGRDRFLERWPRPSPFAPGIVLAFRIVTPSAAVTSPISPAAPDVTWLPNAPDGKATEIDILLAEASVNVPGWPGRLSMGTSLVGSLQLGAGATAWVVYWTIDLPDKPSLPRGTGRFYKGRSAHDLQGANLRALTFGSEPDGSRVIYDFAVETSQRTSRWS
jgi:hypothetical protein